MGLEPPSIGSNYVRLTKLHRVGHLKNKIDQARFRYLACRKEKAVPLKHVCILSDRPFSLLH
jgi:hypothetical protein